jgi:hypothetical protein
MTGSLEAEKLCRAELPPLRERNDLRGEALLVLSAVEMLLESRRREVELKAIGFLKDYW